LFTIFTVFCFLSFNFLEFCYFVSAYRFRSYCLSHDIGSSFIDTFIIYRLSNFSFKCLQMLNVFIDFTFEKGYLFIILHLNFSSHNLLILLIIFNSQVWKIFTQSISVIIQFQILCTLSDALSCVFGIKSLFILFINKVHRLFKFNLFV
jgi:hypothetical protein